MIQNLLVTGGAGFIGANFVRYLLEESEFQGRLINVDKLTYAGNLESLKGLQEKFPDRYQFIQADICDFQVLAKVFEEYPIDSICHLAAESHVDRSIVSPDAFIQTNILGTFNLLELAKRKSDRIRRFHHVSTDEVFGSLALEDPAFHEETPYRPNSPYSASKASSDHLVRAYHHTYGLPVTISNCSNNYGPYQFPEKLIPLMILHALQGKALPIYGDGKNIRDWLYVEDHCEALWLILKNGKVGETYNIGGDCEKTNLEIVEILCAILDEIQPKSKTKPHRQLMTFVQDRPGHDRRYAINFSKINKELGWRPRETFESGIRKTIAWYLKNFEWIEHVQSGEYRKWIEENYDKRSAMGS